MHAEQLLQLLHNPNKITPEDVSALHDLLKLYPYFQAAYALLAKAAYEKDQSSAGHAVQTAAVYATDRHYLKALLENTAPFLAPCLGDASPKQPNKILQAEVYDFVNSYIDTIQQKAQRKGPNQRGLVQLDNIQAFLQKNVKFKPRSLQDGPNKACQIDLSQPSTTFHDDLATEQLAHVLQQQGKLKRAVAIYEKLVLKFPEKKSYFTPLIEKLKRQI